MQEVGPQLRAGDPFGVSERHAMLKAILNDPVEDGLGPGAAILF